MGERNKLSRRNMLKLGMAGTVAGVLDVSQAREHNNGGSGIKVTPSEVEGPFYPVVEQQDKDADLTRVTGQSGTATGPQIIIRGFVKDTAGNPVEKATIDVWQANAAGRYNHPRDSNSAPRDPYFQGWAIIHSGRDGLYRFKTVKPGAYPATATWTRPPHIHFKISKKGFSTLITQMYFPGEPLNDADLLFKSKSLPERSLMIAQKKGEGEREKTMFYEYNIVLDKY